MPGRLHTHHHRLRHSLLSIHTAGQPASAATRFTLHAPAIPTAATFFLRSSPARQPQPLLKRFLAFIYIKRRPCRPRKSPRSLLPSPSPTTSSWLPKPPSVGSTPSPSPSASQTSSEDSYGRSPARPRPSSSFRGGAVAGILAKPVLPAASTSLLAVLAPCSRPIRPVTSISRPFAAHQPPRLAASAICRAHFVRIPAGLRAGALDSCATRAAGMTRHQAANLSHSPALPQAAAKQARMRRRVCHCCWPCGRRSTSHQHQPAASLIFVLGSIHRDRIVRRSARCRLQHAHSS